MSVVFIFYENTKRGAFMKFKGIFFLIIVLLLLSYTAFSMGNILFPSSTDFETAKKDLYEKLDSKLKEGHGQIIREFEIDLDEWIQFDISDIPELTEGNFRGIDKETGREFMRIYHADIIDEYHKTGDLKPLFLISNNSNKAMVGFLHSDNTATIIKLKTDNGVFVVTEIDKKGISANEK